MHGVTIELDEGGATFDRNAGKKIHAQIGQQVIDDAPYAWVIDVPESAPMHVHSYAWIRDSVPRYRDLR